MWILYVMSIQNIYLRVLCKTIEAELRCTQ